MSRTFAAIFTCLLLALPTLAAPNDAVTSHPLDPLTPDEITATARVLQAAGKVNGRSRFALVALREPPKEEVLRFRPGAERRREAFAVIYQPETNTTFEAVVDLRGGALGSWEKVPDAQPALMAEEVAEVAAAVQEDAGWQRAVRARGITDFARVQVDPWSAGHFGIPEENGVRLVRAVAYYRGSRGNAYARPIEGLVAYVDVNARKVVRLIDAETVPVPAEPAELDAGSAGKPRPATRPLQVTLPKGPGFTLYGHEVRWQNWRFRFGLHHREGVVLYTVGYEDGGRVRPILCRASLSEMVVPYGDPGPAWFFRNAFDMGECGLGWTATSLEAGADCPDHATLFDAVVATVSGTPRTIPKAVALYERDGGLLWRHFDGWSGRLEARRGRQLVLKYIATLGNYDYGFSWVFHQDGTLEMDVQLTGIVSPKGVPERKKADHAGGSSHRVARAIEAVHHQHFFNFRLDLDVDGPNGNRVVELNTEALPPGPENPYRNAFTMTETVLRNEKEARRHLNLTSGRKWKVVNPARKNALGQPTGYVLVPGENALPLAAADSSIRKRAGFLDAHLWATPYAAAEMNAAGPYINQHPGGDGLTRWTRANRSLEDEDVVLWYTLGVTHVARPEEWPVMPVHHAGFKLMPAGFFSRNPALDVPREKKR